MGWLKDASGGKISTPKATWKGVAKGTVDLFSMGTGLGDKLFGEKKQPGEPGYDAEQQRLIEEQRKAYQDFIDGGQETYTQGNPLAYQNLDPATLERLKQSGLSDITTDPAYHNAELDALRSLEEQSATGLTARDRADLAKVTGDSNRQNAGRIGAIRQNMAARGASGSGMDLVAQMQSAQAAADRDAAAALETAATSGERRNAATLDRATLAGQMDNREYSRKASAATANDAIARFNANNTNTALTQNNNGQNGVNTQNWQRGNTVSDKNAAAKYGFAKDKLGATKGSIQTQFDYNADRENSRLMKEAADKKANEGMYGAVLGAGGAAVGGFYGGPGGAAAGGQLGQEAGKTYANYASGGRIPGPEVVPGDDPANDIVPINVSPGETVLPKSVSNDPEAAAQFVARLNAEQDPVQRYKALLEESDKRKQSARSTQDNMSYANTAGKLMNDFNNSQKRDVVLKNKMSDLGHKPTSIAADRPEWDSSALDKFGNQAVSRANEDNTQAEKSFNNNFAMEDRRNEMLGAQTAQHAESQKADPKSAESAAARAYLKQVAPNATNMPGFENLSAAQIEKLAPSLSASYEKQAGRDNDAANRAESRNERYALRGEARQNKLADKEEDRQYKEGIKAQDAQAKAKVTMQEVEDRRTNIKQNVGLLRKMIDEDGTYEMFGSHNQELNRRVEEIATDMAKLADPTSVARPQEVDMIKKQLVESGIWSRNSTADDVLKSFGNDVDRRAENAYTIRGLKGPSTQQTPPPATDYDSMSDEELQALYNKGK